MQGFHLTLIGHVPHPTLQNLSLHKNTNNFSFSADVLRSCLTVQSSLSSLAQKRAAAIDMPHGVLPTLPLPFFKDISKLCTAVFTLYEYSWPKPFFQHVQGASSSADLKKLLSTQALMRQVIKLPDASPVWLTSAIKQQTMSQH